MKKATFIILTLLLLLQAGGLLSYYQVQQLRAHCKMQKAMAKNVPPSISLKMPYETYRTSRVGERELRVAGKMYDVRSVTISGNNVLLSVVHDKEEETAWSKVASVLGQLAEGDSAVPDLLMNLLGFVYLLPESYNIQFVPVVLTRHLFAVSTLVADSHASIVVPPPDCVSC